MFLKSIELFGFKSFADRSRIEFSDGISTLLGPNGCGKSNVVDAVKWVLGEQSTRTLRADKMEDVIFNGTENRKALNVAEVTLSISNDGGILPLDIPEIEVKRRVYRSGESEYYVNGTPVKLRELRELFLDTGIGKSAYSIMEQGKIDQVLSNKPEERRYLFEEAAGITKIKIKGAEAERKLVRTEDNMKQVESILSEVRRSYENLKGQAEKTKRYRQLKDQIFELELDIQLLKLRELFEKRNDQEKKLEAARGEKDKLKAEIDGINESMEEDMDNVNSMETKLIENQKKLYGIDLQKNSRDSQIQILNERRQEVERQIEADMEKEKEFVEKLGSIRDRREEKTKEAREMETRIAEIEENIGSFTQSIERSEERIKSNEQEIARLEKEIAAFEREQEELQRELRGITDSIVQELDKGLKDTGYSYRERIRLEEEMEQQLKTLLIQIEGKQKLLTDAGQLEEGSGDEAGSFKGGLKTILTEWIRQGRALEEMLKEYKGKIPRFLDDFLAPEGIITQKRELDARMDDLKAGIKNNRDAAAALRGENKELSGKIDQYRKTLEELRVNNARLKTQFSALKDQLKALEREEKQQEELRVENQKEMVRLKERTEGIKEKVETLQQERKELEKEERELKKELAELEKGISHHNKTMLDNEKRLRRMMESLSQKQDRVEKVQIQLSESNSDIKNIYENFRDRFSRDLSEFEDRIYELTSDPKALKETLGERKTELKQIGQVNLMAPEEYEEVKERYDFLNNQMEDLKQAREDLKQITAQIKKESTDLFIESYNKIKKNFHMMFRRLFGGGRGELRLTEPDMVLTSGIEILAQPPGKKLENIGLLSGGERSLTAVALLFATYMVRPSPFCILDEIDAALDEANVGRFVSMLMEFSEKSQFVIITHNKKTVAGAKAMLGVTMEESGVSKVVAIRIDERKDEAVPVTD